MYLKSFFNYIFTILCIYSVLVLVSGGMKQKLISIEDCDIPESNYDRENLVTHNWTIIQVKGENVITANFTIEKTTPSVFYNIRGFKMPQKKPVFNISRLHCNNPVAVLFLKKLKVVYEDKTCTAPPRTYRVKRVSMNDFSKFYQYAVSGYNLFLIELELANDNGVTICIGVTLDLSK